MPQLSRHPVFYTSGCVADRFPSGCAGAFRGMDCFVWKGSIWPFEATVTWDWDFGPICLAGKVYALFLHVGNFAAFCVEAEIYGSEVLLYAKRVDESVCFLSVMIFLCNFEQLNNQSNIWIRPNRSLWSWH